MKQTVIVALCAALAGAAVREIWQATHRAPLAFAQDTRVESLPPVASGSSRRFSPPGLPAAAAELPDDASFTAEELVNIAVYEKVNRSVVNISTKSVRNDAFFFFDVEVPSEGAGSGSVLDTQGHVLTNYHVDRRGPRDRGDAVRRQELRRPAGRQGRVDRRGRHQDRRSARVAAARHVRRLHAAARGPTRVRHRQPVWPGAHADHRHHLQPQSHAARPQPAARSSRSSRSTRRSTRATRAGRCWTATAG